MYNFLYTKLVIIINNIILLFICNLLYIFKTFEFKLITFFLENFYLTDAYGLNEPVLEDPNPINNVTRLGGKKPAVFLRLKLVFYYMNFGFFSNYTTLF